MEPMAPWTTLAMILAPKDWCCCRVVSNFGIPFLEDRRHQVLKASLVFTGVGFVLAFIGFIGGYSSGGFLLRLLPWAVWKTPNKRVNYAGVRYACTGTSLGDANASVHWVRKNVDARCTLWSEFNCNATKVQGACQGCQVASKAMMVPVVIAVIAYLTFANHARKRYIGEDSAQHKIMACFSAFVGGANFFGAMVGYWQSCVNLAASDASIDASMGLGLICMLWGAAALKGLVGLLQLGLPVEAPEDEEENEEESADEDSED